MVACDVFGVFFLDPRVRNVNGKPLSYPRNVLFAAGGRGFHSQSGTVMGSAMVDSRPRRSLLSWVSGRPVAQRGGCFPRSGGFTEAGGGRWGRC